MTLEEIQPFGDRLLVLPDPKAATSAGGLHIPDVVLADNPNYFYVSGTVLKLGDGYREDVYECCNQQCRYQARRTVGEYCPVCKATQRLVSSDLEVRPFDVQVGDRVLFGRFAGKQLECEVDSQGYGKAWDRPRVTVLMMREVEILGVLTGDEQAMPGYQSADFRQKATSGLTPEVTTVVR